MRRIVRKLCSDAIWWQSGNDHTDQLAIIKNVSWQIDIKEFGVYSRKVLQILFQARSSFLQYDSIGRFPKDRFALVQNVNLT